MLTQVMRTNILSFAPDLGHVAPTLRENEKKFIAMLQAVLQCPFHYFSYSYDLTQSCQRIAAFTEARNKPVASLLVLVVTLNSTPTLTGGT